MRIFNLFSWYTISILEYCAEMLPCMAIALLVFLLLRPARRRRLETQLGLFSGPWREGALLLFVLFSVGLAALTLFPARFWAYVIDLALRPEVRAQGLDLAALYSGGGTIAQRIAGLPDMLTPFQEISRALRHGSWLMFMLLGNIAMFIPIGFFPALLWRGGRWWRSALIGFCTSFFIEFTQFFIGRSTDIDDVLLNTTGALVGFWLFFILRALFPRLILKFQCKHRKDADNGRFGGT